MSDNEYNAVRGNARNEYGFEYWYQKYRNWVLSHKENSTKYILISAAIYLTLVGIAIFVPMPQSLRTVVSFPAGVLLFLVPLGFTLLRTARNPEKLTTRERIAPSRRRRTAVVGAVLLIVFLLTGGSQIPYALGGTLTMAIVLGLYNFARRTPEEITLAEAGIPDPREVTVVSEPQEEEDDEPTEIADNNTVDPR